MARLGTFGEDQTPLGWFGDDEQAEGWFDEDLIPAEVGGAPEIVPVGVRVVRQAVKRGSFY